MTLVESTGQGSWVVLSDEATAALGSGGTPVRNPISPSLDQMIAVGGLVLRQRETELHAESNQLVRAQLQWDPIASRRHNRTILIGAVIGAIAVLGASGLALLRSVLTAQHDTPPSVIAKSLRPISPTLYGGKLGNGAMLRRGQSAVSTNHQFRLVVQTDGNVVEYHGSRAIWQMRTNTPAKAVQRIVMQPDCNVVAYTSHGYSWTSGTAGRGTGCVLRVQDDGNVVIYRVGNHPVWDRLHGSL